MAKHSEIKNEELFKLVNEKIDEDLLISILYHNNILEITKIPNTELYKVRRAIIPKNNFSNVYKNNLDFKLSRWNVIKKEALNSIIEDSRDYLTDVFFDI